MLKHSSDPTSRKVMEHSPPETFDDGRFQPPLDWVSWIGFIISDDVWHEEVRSIAREHSSWSTPP